jgi:hypothetical protein
LSAIPALSLTIFLGWLRWELQPLERYYLRAYWESSEGAKRLGSTTQIEWLFKAAPGRKSQPVIDVDVASEGTWSLSLELSSSAREQGWIELGKSRPVEVASTELEPLLQEYFYDHRSIRQLLAEPLLYAAMMPLIVLYLALVMRRELGLEWSRLCEEVSDSDLAFHWKQSWSQFVILVRSWIYRVIKGGISQLRPGRLDSPKSTPSACVPDILQQAQSSTMKAEKDPPQASPKKWPQGRLVFPGTASVGSANKQPKPWHESQWID